MTPFPISESSPAEHVAALPDATDCVVIGGGIIGVMTAWNIAKSGLRVVLVEKGRVAGEQSSRNWGWIRQQGRDPAELPIMVESNALWQQLARDIGEDIGLQHTGALYLASKPGEVEGYENWIPYARAHGLDTRILTGAEVAEMLPKAATRWAGAIWTASDMRAEPWVAVPAFARAAVRAGVTIIENCAVRMLDIEAGHIAGVVTEKGRIRAPSVVVAGGAWSSLLLRHHALSIPQLSVRATVVATEPMEEVFSGSAVDDRVAFRRRADGGYTLAPSRFHEMYIGPDAFRSFTRFIPQLMTDPWGTKYRLAAPKDFPDAWGTARHWSEDEISPFERCRILNPAPNEAKVMQMAQNFTDTFPHLGPTRIKTAWAGMIDAMPDIVPVVDRVDALPGLVISTGMCGHGFGIGPAFGKITAALVTGDSPGYDLSRFRLSRFTDGSRLTLGPSL